MVIIPAPLILALWLLDFYIVVACIRLVFGQINKDWARRAAAKLAPITDPLPDAIGRSLGSGGTGSIPRWLPWLIIIFAAILVRSSLMSFAIHVR